MTTPKIVAYQSSNEVYCSPDCTGGNRVERVIYADEVGDYVLPPHCAGCGKPLIPDAGNPQEGSSVPRSGATPSPSKEEEFRSRVQEAVGALYLLIGMESVERPPLASRENWDRFCSRVWDAMHEPPTERLVTITFGPGTTALESQFVTTLRDDKDVMRKALVEAGWSVSGATAEVKTAGQRSGTREGSVYKMGDGGVVRIVPLSKVRRLG